MINEHMRQTDPARWLSEMLREKEEERYEVNKQKVRKLLIKHNAEDLIPMLLED
jgi:hypothetical protein